MPEQALAIAAGGGAGGSLASLIAYFVLASLFPSSPPASSGNCDLGRVCGQIAAEVCSKGWSGQAVDADFTAYEYYYSKGLEGTCVVDGGIACPGPEVSTFALLREHLEQLRERGGSSAEILVVAIFAGFVPNIFAEFFALLRLVLRKCRRLIVGPAGGRYDLDFAR